MTRSERQELGVKKWIENRCKGTLMWSTGSGKTRAGILAIKAFLTKNKNKIIKVIVPTEILKTQWLLELNKYDLLYEVSIEIINSAIKSSQKIDLVILDECHRYSSDTFYQIFSKRNPSLVLGLSATFNRLDGRHELLKQYCPVIDIITVKEAIDNKWLAPYREYKVMIYPEDIESYRRMNESFINTFSVFNFDFNLALKCLTNIVARRQYAKVMGFSLKEMDAIVFTWNIALKFRKSYVANHPKKLEITRKILSARPYSKAITFSATKAQAEKIGIGYVVHSGKTKKKNALSIEAFKKLKTGVINTAKALDEGSDIPGLNLAIVLSNSSSQIQKTQRIGRTVRYEENKEAEIFTLVIAGTVEENWFNNSSAGKTYIEITEDELDIVLNNSEINIEEKIAEEVPLLFRL